MSECHNDFWFRDGNIVVVAQESSFRMYLNILARHSDVPREFLNDEALAALPDWSENCPVLCTDDKASALAQLLQIIYDGEKRCFFHL